MLARETRRSVRETTEMAHRRANHNLAAALEHFELFKLVLRAAENGCHPDENRDDETELNPGCESFRGADGAGKRLEFGAHLIPYPLANCFATM